MAADKTLRQLLKTCNESHFRKRMHFWQVSSGVCPNTRFVWSDLPSDQASGERPSAFTCEGMFACGNKVSASAPFAMKSLSISHLFRQGDCGLVAVCWFSALQWMPCQVPHTHSTPHLCSLSQAAAVSYSQTILLLRPRRPHPQDWSSPSTGCACRKLCLLHLQLPWLCLGSGYVHWHKALRDGCCVSKLRLIWLLPAPILAAIEEYFPEFWSPGKILCWYAAPAVILVHLNYVFSSAYCRRREKMALQRYLALKFLPLEDV